MAHELVPAEIRDRLVALWGWNAYNRIVKSVPDVRQWGRLRFWQEQLLQQALDAGIPIRTADEFIRVFSGASPVAGPTEPWTREVFLRRIEEFPHGGFPLDETPPEWMAAAWEIERVRTELSSEMARTVSKTGELAYTSEYLRYLSRSLPLARQVELFHCIRDDRNELREAEFRPGFERAFPDSVPLLPPPVTEKQLSEMLGMSEDDFRRQFLNPDPIPADDNDDARVADEDIPF
jgi:hypothetical protein